jgi:hypothetical protein
MTDDLYSLLYNACEQEMCLYYIIYICYFFKDLVHYRQRGINGAIFF